MKHGRFLFGLALWVSMVLPIATGPAAAAEQRELWEALGAPGHLVVMRHALAPGTGDPAGFELRECGTQRNLSDAGREQARRIGERFRANGIESAAVYSSQWCRCLDTARLLGLGSVEELPVINSFFRDYARRDEQTLGLEAWIADHPLNRPVVLVTHQVNITALTGVYPGSGEMVVLRRGDDGRIAVLGTIETD